MKLEIQFLSGDTEIRPLDSGQSISIGSADSCDIQVEDDDVALLHCRLSWSGAAWEIKAANLDGVEVNGKLVREATLTADDTVRIGAIDIRLVDDTPVAGDAADESEGFIPLASSDDDISLKPLDKGEKPAGAFGVADAKEEEGDAIQLPKDVRQERDAAEAKPQRQKSRKSKRTVPEPDGIEESEHPINQIFEDDDLDPLDDTGEEEEVQPMPGQAVSSRSHSTGSEAAVDGSKTGGDAQGGLKSSLSEKLTPVARRPGEQETLKSPVVLGLVGFAIFLLLASTTFYFMFSRNTIEGLFEISAAEVEEGSYSQAKAHLEEFLKIYPNNEEFSPRATFLLNEARVESLLGGAKEWENALVAVDVYRKECQDFENYDPEKKLYLFNTVVKIAIGSANEGGRVPAGHGQGAQTARIERGVQSQAQPLQDRRGPVCHRPGADRRSPSCCCRQVAQAGSARRRFGPDRQVAGSEAADGGLDREAKVADTVCRIQRRAAIGSQAPGSSDARENPCQC